MGIHRRTLLKGIAGTGIMSILAPVGLWANRFTSFSFNNETSGDIFKQQPLPYAYDALEPAVDAQTMNIHFTKHAAAYVKNLNEACMAIKLESSDGSDNSLIAILTEISKHSAKMRNNAGGHYNHTFFWNCMTPEKDKKVMGKQTAKLINEQFGNIQTLQDEFMQKAKSVFGTSMSPYSESYYNSLAIVSRITIHWPYSESYYNSLAL